MPTSNKGVVMRPISGRLERVTVNTHKTEALRFLSVLGLQSFIVTLMAVMMLSVCITAYAADAHDHTAHDAAKKVYPSRAAQGADTPLASGASIHKMTLSHHELEAWSFVPKRKDRIEITNRSEITHALYITYPDGTVVNLEVQIPGDVVTWTIPDDAEGEYWIRCWIHPVIRANMTITE